MSRIRLVPTAIATAVAMLATALVVLVAADGASAASTPPTFLLVSGQETDPSYRSAISSDGGQIAYQTVENGQSVIKVAPSSGGGTALPNAETSATTPSMSGDAGLVSFLGDLPGTTLDNPQHPQIYVVDRQDPQNPIVKQVTETPGDLPYQRVEGCAINTEGGDAYGCEPKLSRDGRTLVAPVRQTIDDSGLELAVGGESLHTDRGLEPLVDLGAFGSPGEAKLTVKNTSVRPIVYPDTGPTIEGDSGFVAEGNTCAATLQPGASCGLTVKYTGDGNCGVEAAATLRLPATSSNGQTALNLTVNGECPRLTAFPPQLDAAAADGCTGPSQYKWALPVADQPQSSDGRPHPYFALGSVPAGELGIAAVILHNSMSTPKLPTLTSTGCQLKFVLPAAADKQACQPGQPIAPQTSCTAYVEYEVGQVAPFFGSFHVGDTVYRISGHASRSVIAAWRDASATGNFGPAQVVSVTGPGNTAMDGYGPTVSADGRWIGYASETALGRPATDPNSPQYLAQVYLHDTDAAGDGTHKSGQTVLVSLKTDGSLPLSADEASVSDDGSRVAFTIKEPIPADSTTRQVYVRDRTSGRSVLASAGPDGSAADNGARGPQLSGDGGTVVYQSDASNLGVGSPAAVRILARDLTMDLAGKRGSNELITVRPDGSGTTALDRFPSVSQDGTQVAFVSADSFVGGDGDTTSDVYYAGRVGHVSVNPVPLDFGTIGVHTTSGPRPVELSNDGQTVVRFSKPYFQTGRTDFEIVGDQCTDQVVRPSESCVYTIEFTPGYVGQRDARFVTSNQSGASVDSVYYEMQGQGTSDARTIGTTSHVSTGDGRHDDPAISDNGQFVAYRTGDTFGETPSNTIWTKNQATDQIQRTSGPDHQAVGPPDISADGNRVAYTAVNQLAGDPATRFVRTLVADRSTPDVTRHEVTGTPTDLRYQRPAPDCLYSGSHSCKPSLAGDGKTIAFPALLASSNPNLRLSVEQSDGPAIPVTSLIDFGSGGVQRLTVETSLPIDFTGDPTIEGGSAFTVRSTDCNRPVVAGTACHVVINYSPCALGGHTGVLRLQGTTPEGQTAVSLTGDNGCVNQAPQLKATPKPAAACTPIPPPTYSPYPYSVPSTSGAPLADAGQLELGQIRYAAIEVPPDTTSHSVSFDSGCEFALVTPTQPDPNRAKACVAGETLPANTGCTAYVGFRPETVDPAVANVRVGAGVYRFTGSGYQNIVLARGDTKGDATFAGTPEIISKDSAGQPINGSEPSLSGDGRYVAFVSSAIIDRPAGSTEQVYRHDRVGGQTVLISALPDGTVSEFGASQPSSSRSGHRIAFITNGRQDDGPGIPSQVYARDVEARKVILVSAVHGSGDKLGDGWSDEPSLSDDGSTVGFTSGASDLVTEPGNEFDAVFVRSLGPDFAGAPAAQRFSERVSLTAAGAAPDTGSSGSPALSSDGAFTAFDSSSRLVATDTDNASDVYVRRRPAQLVVDPASVDFGSVKVGTTTPPRRMTVRNIGMGPAAAGPDTTAAPFAPGDNRCTVTLHRGESCVVDATFKPVVLGRADAVLNLPSVQGYLPGPAVAVTLTGTGTTVLPPAGLSVVPGRLVFPARQLGQSGPPSKVVLRNTGGVPLTVKPTLTSPGGDFGADLTACASLMPAAQCEFSVDFVPRNTGQRTGSIVFTPTSQDPAVKSPTPVTVALDGSGTPGPAVASMSVEPGTLLFGPQILLSNSPPRSIAVTNTGTVPLDVTAVSANADFTSVSACGRIQPGQQCEIAVRFVPRALGTRFGAVQVAAGVAGAGVAAPFPVSVGLRGTTATPLLQVEPPVVRPGQIVLATGTNFPPGRPVVLAWQTGLGTQQVVADGAGRFQTAVLVFKRDVLGQRLLAAQIPGQSVSVNSVMVLVMPLSPQPPNFVLRW